MKQCAKTGLLCAAIALVSAAPAQGALLLYAESNFRVQIGSFSNAMGTYRNVSGENNDVLSSFKNQTGFSVAFWHHANGSHTPNNPCFTGKPNSQAAWFAFDDDNQMTSFQLGRSC